MNMKKIIIVGFAAILPLQVIAQETEADPVAVLILDRMSQVIGELGSCSFTLDTSHDIQDNTFFLPEDGLGPVKHFATHTVYMVGPDMMLVDTHGDRGHQGYWYKGDSLTYYSYDENNFGIVRTPENIIDMIYSVHEMYGIEFPAADFFNPYFTDDLLAQCNKLRYLGTAILGGKECFRIVASGEEKNVQLWISNDALTLPKKMVIVYFKEERNPQYEVTFSNWQLNPELPGALFDFMPPPEASQIILVSKNVN